MYRVFGLTCLGPSTFLSSIVLPMAPMHASVICFSSSMVVGSTFSPFLAQINVIQISDWNVFDYLVLMLFGYALPH